MKISYDKKVDALYIKILEGKHECHTLKLSDEIALNITENEKLVGIEVLDAKKILGNRKLPEIILENLSAKEILR